MNEIGWWVLVLLAIGMLHDFIERRDKANGKTSTEDDVNRAMIFGSMMLLWGIAAIVRVLFF